MMDTTTFLFIFCLILIVDSRYLFSLIAGKDRKFNGEPPMKEKNCRSVVECALYCQQLPNCKAVNAIRSEKNTFCELLDKTPKNPKHLEYMEGSNYWEKTCQPIFGIESANANKSGPGDQNKVVISADGGVNVYTVLFDDQYEAINTTYTIDVFSLTQGKHHKVSSSATLFTGEPPKSTTFLENDGWLYCEEDGSLCPFWGEWPKRTDMLLEGNFTLKAFMATKMGDGFYIFSYDKVIEVGFQTTNTWQIRNVFDLNNDNEDHLWKNAPKNVIAASWIDKDAIFLATRDYFIVIDSRSKQILERGHICKPKRPGN